MSNHIGTKDDKRKPRWSLLPKGTIGQVIAVLEFGAAKYRVDNWMHVPDPDIRYYNAAMRHLEAWWMGEKDDPESKLPHLAHAVCCLLFLMWFHLNIERTPRVNEGSRVGTDAPVNTCPGNTLGSYNWIPGLRRGGNA